VDYRLRARLDPVEHRVTGSGRIVLHNDTDAPLSELYLHLYLNAFRHARTLFYRTPGVMARSQRWPAQWGSIDVTELKLLPEGTELWPWPPGQNVPHSPDDPEDQTDIAVKLPRVIAPRERVELQVSWTSKLPSLVDRTGFAGDFHFMGQWFPKLAKLEPDGTWAHFRFHPHAEFYANFGDYDVQLDVPKDEVVGATGQLSSTHCEQERCVHHYRALQVHDFAWTAWRHFEVRREHVDGTLVQVLYPPGHSLNTERTLQALRHGLPFFGSRFGRYPYPTLTVVHPPAEGRGAGGMEYPTLITTGGEWYLGLLTRSLEHVTMHELAHQWFYGLLASHEASWPFLDEGLSSYADQLALSFLLGSASGAQLFGLKVSALAYYRWLAVQAGTGGAVARSGAQFESFTELAAYAYGRTATLLATLERLHGAAFERALGDYAAEQRFGHPTPDDLLRHLERALGAHSAEQARRVLFDGAWLDYSVDEVSLEGRRGALHVARAKLLRQGELRWPVEVAFYGEHGEVQRQVWDGASDSATLEYVAETPLVAVVIDPERKLLLDQKLSNNAGRVERRWPLATGAWLAQAFQVLTRAGNP
jgi:hypothetical protein